MTNIYLKATTEKETERVTGDFFSIEDSYDYSTELLLQVDEKTIITGEDKAMLYLDTFRQNMESTIQGTPIIDLNDFRTFFNQSKELHLLPTVRAGDEEELMYKTELALNNVILDGGYVMLMFSSTEDDWRLECYHYDDFCEAMRNTFKERVHLLFGSTIPDARQPYTRRFQASILILHMPNFHNAPHICLEK